MVKQTKKFRQRSRKYDKITQEEREQIVKMKENGSTCREISEQMKKNIKTIQSIKSIEKKSEYADLKKALIEYGFQKIMEMQQLDKTNSKIIDQLEQRTSKFWNLIPEQKKFSNKRRIIQQIVMNIVERVQNTIQKNNDSHQQTNIITKEEFEEKKAEIPINLFGQTTPLHIAKAYYYLMSMFIQPKNNYAFLL
ncbi:unnamed protein product [Paramecium pentaurelia]|uniref:Uncharacterized protein n=1 Tax=Paramecium pentaurelia TaxID=43138 RepID=A0A8S1TN57_9CILI|nr:unnamed protein product [Paramecium pentaurelia]